MIMIFWKYNVRHAKTHVAGNPSCDMFYYSDITSKLPFECSLAETVRVCKGGTNMETAVVQNLNVFYKAASVELATLEHTSSETCEINTVKITTNKISKWAQSTRKFKQITNN